MKALVVYDSAFGNTAIIAKTIADSLGCDAILAKDFQQSALDNIDLIVVGTPTQGGMATKPVRELIKSLGNNLKVAVFDTRFGIKDQGFWLKLLMKTIGFAAEKMAKQAKAQGLKLVDKPTEFIVNSKEGPLRDGEIERAKAWATSLTKINI